MTPADALAALQDSEPAVRARAADAFGPDDLGAVPVLAVASADPDDRVAAAARSALARLAPASLRAAAASAGEPLCSRLGGLLAALQGEPIPTPDPFPAALRCPESLLPVIEALSRAPDGAVRTRAVEMLGGFPARRVLPTLLALLAHPDAPTRRVAADVLAVSPSGSPRVLPALARLRGDSCPEVRDAARRALLAADPTAQSFPDGDAARAAFGLLLADADPEVRGHALRIAARFRDEWVADVATAGAGDPLPALRVLAARLLESRPSAAAREALRQLLLDLEEGVRLAAVGAYSRYPAEDLAVWLDDPAASVRCRALEAAGPAVLAREPARVERLLVDPSPAVRGELARALGRSAGPRHRDFLARLLRDGDPAVRGAAFDALWASVPHAELLSTPPVKDDPELLASAIARLASGSWDAPSPLVPALARHPAARVRRAAAEALAGFLPRPDYEGRRPERRWMGEGEAFQARYDAVSALRDLSLDSDPDTRAAAAWSLRRLPGDDSVRWLLASLTDEVDRVRAAAADALVCRWRAGHAFGSRLEAATLAAPPHARPDARAVLAAVADRSCVGVLLRLAREPGQAAGVAEILDRVRARTAAPVSRRVEEEIAFEIRRQREGVLYCMALDAFGEMCASAKPPPAAEPAREVDPPPLTDDVTLSLVLPEQFRPGTTAEAVVWIAPEELRALVIERIHDEAGGDPFRVLNKAGVEVRRGARLVLRLSIAGFAVDDPEDEVKWTGRPANARFTVSAPRGIEPGGYQGQVTVHAGGLQIGRLSFVAKVGGRTAEPAPTPGQFRWHRRVFASYAREDRAEVLARVQGMKAVRPDLDVFLDVLSLRAGEHWRERLAEEIRSRDALFLFWSAAASRSEWVEWEWRTALRERGAEAIDPVPLAPPAEVPPPPELAHLHFDDWLLAYARHATGA